MIKIKTPEEIKIMSEGGKCLAEIVRRLKREVKPGITTQELERLAESLIFKSGGRCSFKGYSSPDETNPKKVYPACLCTSVNEEIVHAIPSGRTLREGDIVSLDIGMKYPAPDSPAANRYGAGKSFHTDMAVTVSV